MKILPIFFIVVVVASCVLIPRGIAKFRHQIKHGLHETPERVSSSALAPSRSIGSKVGWITRLEVLRGTDGRSWLRTDRFLYEVGCMSPAGFVKGVQGYVAYCVSAMGIPCYVCATDRPVLAPIVSAGCRNSEAPAPESLESDADDYMQAAVKKPGYLDDRAQSLERKFTPVDSFGVLGSSGSPSSVAPARGPAIPATHRRTPGSLANPVTQPVN